MSEAPDRRARIHVLAAAALLAIATTSLAATVPPALVPAAPPGYFVDAGQARLPAPEPCDEKHREYTCSIVRTAPDEAASRLLAIAEAVYPSRELLAGLAAQEGYEMGSDTARVLLWWTKGTGARRVPYAVTRGTLDYYTRLTQKYRDRDYREPGAHPMFTSALVYRGSITRRASYEVGTIEYKDVYVASLAMSWTFDDGVFLPVVTAHRTVVLTPRGELLHVNGDGQGSEDVSFSTHRGMGRSTELRR